MDSKTNFTVVRNMAYSANSIGVRERHNERKNETYYNSDIVPERAALNVNFRQSLSTDGTPETYEQTFNRLLSEGVIVKRGLKADAKVFDELVFDVNTAYFDERGGYDYAKRFYEAAYRLAVKEAGGEEYIISAVMHADERNTALSDQLGRDAYHYHLHVVYVPVVEKRILWTKRCKDPALVGTVKEIIPQISHSKKWPRFKDASGKWINSYSLLQDRFFEGMRAFGFEGFERGERGSTAEHLEVLDYKIKKDSERLADLTVQTEKKHAEGIHLTEATKVRADEILDLVPEIIVIGFPLIPVAPQGFKLRPGVLQLRVQQGAALRHRRDALPISVRDDFIPAGFPRLRHAVNLGLRRRNIRANLCRLGKLNNLRVFLEYCQYLSF